MVEDHSLGEVARRLVEVFQAADHGLGFVVFQV
jgi:hypothetical protein